MTILKRGDRGEAVEAWQIFLTGRGFDPQGVDGRFGPDTEAAVEQFQAVHGLPQTGAIDAATAAKARELGMRSEEHTSELQSLMRISYAVFCLKKKKEQTTNKRS